MATVLEVLTTLGVDELKKQGMSVKVKTDITPAFTAWDINNESEGESFIKGGVRVVDDEGTVVQSFGDWPKTNYLKAALLYGSLIIASGVAVIAIRKL